MYKPELMKKWKLERDYGGEDLSEWYILAAQTRDSYLLERDNFKSIQEHIKAKGFEIAGNMEDCKQDNAVLLASFGHWACGWVEALMIHESNDKALMLGDEIKQAIEDYPVFNEESYYQGESDLQVDYIKEYVIKEYLRDNDIELSDQAIDDAVNYILDNFQCEINGYDEVILPKELDVEAVVKQFS